MADVIVKLKVMPESPEVALEALESEVKKLIEDFGAQLHKVEKEPVAFGLVAMNFIFIYDEKLGTTDKLEEDIAALEFVSSAEAVDVRRAFG
jgi:elongation factor 1-beta